MNKFISFEGIDGCGKSTQIHLMSKYFKKNKIENSIIREPGDTKISESIREILLNRNNQISLKTETLLFLSARSQLVNEVLIPKMKNNEIVLCDRYLDSTLAYQGYGNNLDLDLIKNMNFFVTSGLLPDLTIIFDINPQISLDRIKSKTLDRMESKGIDFFERVRQGYLEIASFYNDRCKVILCEDKNPEEIHEEVLELFKSNIFKGEF